MVLLPKPSLLATIASRREIKPSLESTISSKVVTVNCVGSAETTLIFAVSESALKIVVLPLIPVSFISPTSPLVLSHALNVKLAAPLKSELAIKRILLLESNSRAWLLLGFPKSSQVLPLFKEYCHLPLALFIEVTAIASPTRL